MKQRREFLRRLSYILFPRRCVCCGRVIVPSLEICPECAENFTRADESSADHAGGCFCAAVCVFDYSGAAEQCVRRLKFDGARENAEFLGAEMAQAVKQAFAGKHFDTVCGVPMRKKNERARGYNQSFLLAKAVAENLGISADNTLLRKIYDTDNQHGLGRMSRMGNLLGVFDVPEPERVRDKTVLLCDDVRTTGSTLNECAKMLMLHRAKEVVCVTVAGTQEKNKN